MTGYHVTTLDQPAFSLAISAAPAKWAGSGSPRFAVGDHQLVILDHASDGVITRALMQSPDGTLRIGGGNSEDAAWLDRVFRPVPADIAFDDPVIDVLARRFAGLRSFTDGSLFGGILTSIIGQSISLASASAAQRRLAFAFTEGIDADGKRLAPLPRPDQLADASVELIRSSGVTWRRAEAIRHIARMHEEGELPPESLAAEELENALRALPLVGPWTAASALLWGIGAPDAYPTGDIALLRAARLAYDRDDMTMRDLERLAVGWRPFRGIASRLLWTALLGPAWEEEGMP